MLLTEQRRELLDKAIAADETYLQALSELDLAQRQLSEAVIAYTDYLAERLLWVRTGDPPSWQLLESMPARLAIYFHSGALDRAFAGPVAAAGVSVESVLIGLGICSCCCCSRRKRLARGPREQRAQRRPAASRSIHFDPEGACC